MRRQHHIQRFQSYERCLAFFSSVIQFAEASIQVYDHIENLQKTSRPRRSKSFSREKFAPTSSFQSDFSANARDTPTSQSRTRMSADSMTSGATAVQPSRPSIDKAKTKLFGHSKTPSDVPDYPSLHKRTESGYSDSVSGSFDLEVMRNLFLKYLY